MAAYSVQQRARCVLWYAKSESITEVQRKFRATYGKHSQGPNTSSIRKWHAKFLETGSVLDSTRKKESTKRTEAAAVLVREHFEEDCHTSQRRAANALNMSRTTIQRILKDLKFHPYKVQVVQRLYDEDMANRLDFADQELRRIAQDPTHLVRMMFSDEAHFHLDGGVNRHNHRYWSMENPNWVMEQGLHSPRVTVWAAIGEAGIIGPFFFDETVNSERYLAMLTDKFWPQIDQKGLTDDIIFMQDGAPPHWGLGVRGWLNEHLPGRWMGRGSPNLPWPPRSPDLTPCDFFLWGFIKSKVYTTRPASLQDLRNRILVAFTEVSVEMRMKILLEYKARLEKIRENGGDHVETC